MEEKGKGIIQDSDSSVFKATMIRRELNLQRKEYFFHLRTQNQYAYISYCDVQASSSSNNNNIIVHLMLPLPS